MITYPPKNQLYRALRDCGDESLDFAVIVTGTPEPSEAEEIRACLDECPRALKDGGLLFVQGCPESLPEFGVHLAWQLSFRYWIAVTSEPRPRNGGLPSVHAGILFFSKGGKLRIPRVRVPHKTCAFCGKSLKDWGGKSHLMNPEGALVSDVWWDLPPADNSTRLSASVLERILRFTGEGPSTGIIGPAEGMADGSHRSCVSHVSHATSETDGTNETAIPRPARPPSSKHQPSTILLDTVHCGDAVDVLRRYPDACADLVFADPPYNLRKGYARWQDNGSDESYIAWCHEWLAEYVRVLKPTGSLYLLNLPKWCIHHAEFLNRRLFFQNWIVWDAPGDPRGKIFPAHYGLLYYTGHPTEFTFNYEEAAQADSRLFCRRPGCMRDRASAGVEDKESLTDIWSGIHRIRHRRDRDYHPCQLPDPLMERIVRLSTNEGDVVLDALCGTGTTLVTAARLGRHYIGADIDEGYVEIARRKIAEVAQNGGFAKSRIEKGPRRYSKRRLQIELRDLALRLGRLPTPEDVRTFIGCDPGTFLEAFPTWGRAIQAAKLELRKRGEGSL